MSGDHAERMAELVAENERLRRELQAARESADTTARLVAEHWAQIEETMSLLEDKIVVEEQLRSDLAAELATVARREREVADARAAAEAANAAKSAFLASMSHELRTPLNAIIGYAEMLIEEGDQVDAAERLLLHERIHAAGRHILGIINDVLDLSKIEAGKMELFAEDFAFDDLAAEVLAAIQPLAERHGNALSAELDPGIGVVRGDLTKLRQILLNLLSNACKFTRDGAVRLRARRAADSTGDWLILAVRDTGIGIPADRLAHLFESYTQADASTQRRFGGTGLGLAITRRLCDLMGGVIAVESALGEGTTFEVRLPARLDLPAA